MKERAVIQRIIAVLLLLLFAISITPKTFIHDSFADHRDAPTCSHTHKEPGFHKEKIDCHFDNLVVTAPYVYQPVPSCPVPVFHEFSYINVYYFSFSQSCFLRKAGRSPPAA